LTVVDISKFSGTRKHTNKTKVRGPTSNHQQIGEPRALHLRPFDRLRVPQWGMESSGCFDLELLLAKMLTYHKFKQQQKYRSTAELDGWGLEWGEDVFPRFL
jgi:hypothetical protein